MRQVFENEPADYDPQDIGFLRSALEGRFERRERGWAICRVVGQLALPSGETIVIASRKSPTAAVLAWAAYADPSLKSLRDLGRLPTSAAAGELSVVVARLFVGEVLRAASRHGLARSYRRVRTHSSTVRGAIDFARLVRRGGDLSRMPCTVWERLADTPLNRTLAKATDSLTRLPGVQRACGPALGQASAMFDGVRRAVDPDLLAGRRGLTRLESGFEGALALARLILRSTGILQGREHTGFAFLVNLEDLFERAVATAFRSSPLAARTKVPVTYRSGRSLRQAAPQSMEMDVFLPSTAEGPVVVDAKYKTRVSAGNLQQMVTYCHLTGAQRAILVFPSGNLTDRQNYFFESPAGSTVRIDVAELRADGRDLAGWRRAAAELVAQCFATQAVAREADAR